MKTKTLLGLMLIAWAVFIGLVAYFAEDAEGHNGRVSSKDQCHKDNKAGNRHWHKDGTIEVGGLCVDGVKLGVCEPLREKYLGERNDPWGHWGDEARAARKYIDCLDKVQ